MPFDNGMMNAHTAAAMPWLVKSGLIPAAGRGRIDDSRANNFLEFADRADGLGKIHWLTAADANNQTNFPNPFGIVTYGLQVLQLATPGVPVITHAGTAGVVTWTYVIVAKNGTGPTAGTSAASAAGSTTTGAATLTAANFNIITFPSVGGAASYDIYRTVAGTTPSTTGLIGNVLATRGFSGAQPATYTFNDTALAGNSATAPTLNTSGAAVAGNSAPIIQAAVQTVNNAAGVTLTSQNILNQLLIRTGAAGVSDTFPTAALLVAAIGPAARVNYGFYLNIRNGNSGTLTLVAGAGGTLAASNTNTVAAASALNILIVLTNVTPASESYSLYTLGAAAF